jgi:hypothetical protein
MRLDYHIDYFYLLSIFEFYTLTNSDLSNYFTVPSIIFFKFEIFKISIKPPSLIFNDLNNNLNNYDLLYRFVFIINYLSEL